jgi:hypothetical protein
VGVTTDGTSGGINMDRPVWLSDEIHDSIVRGIAASRYPFPDQTDWPPTYLTLTNEMEATRGIETEHGVRYPDIVIVDSATGDIAEIGEVEVEVGEHMVEKWRLYADNTRSHSTSGAPHFFIYVPEGLQDEALRILSEHGVPFGGVRSYLIDINDELRVNPIATPVDPKDHRPT